VSNQRARAHEARIAAIRAVQSGFRAIGRDDGDMDMATTAWPASMVLAAGLIFWGYCLYDFTQVDERAMRTFSKPVWLVVLIFGSVLGGLLWFSVGRPQRR
jgi:Phospholipase_D-nuclease N-terminal